MWTTIWACWLLQGSVSESVTLEPDRDTTIYAEDGQLSNGAGRHLFVGVNGNADARRALLYFDVAGTLPPGVSVVGVTLRLRVTKTQVGPQLVGVHRVSSDWGEGTSVAGGEEGAGGVAADGDATWTTSFFPGVLWTSAGGDFDATPSASALPGFAGTVASWSSPALAADVQHWLDAPEANFGWLLRHEAEAGGATAKRFGSRENSEPIDRPMLEIEYETLDCVSTRHCTATSNSTGFAARVFASGGCSVAADGFVLRASPVPNGPFLFFSGTERVQVPFGNGFRCVGGSVRRLLPPGAASGQTATRTLRLSDFGLGPGVRSFQCWFRDGQAGASGFNTSDAVEVLLTQ